ncbi:MAG: hypothetical protein ACRD5D_03300 [Candidatus Polarisedimenticolia bacterium]
MSRALRAAPAAFLWLLIHGFAPAPAFAWTDATRLRMIEDALKISPPALRAVLKHFGKDLGRGMLEPGRHEGEEIHYQHADGRSGLAARAVERKRTEIGRLIEERKPLRRFAYEMGVLAHLVSDLEFPLNASDADPREPLYHEAYRRYVEERLGKIPFVFDRVPPPPLERGDLRGFALAAAQRAGRNYAHIGKAFKDDGTPTSPAAVDERSVPFGVASLAYSHAASDIAWVWLSVWRSINGDLEGTPALNLPPPRKAGIPKKPAKRKEAPPKAGQPAPPAGAAKPAPAPEPDDGAETPS